MTTLDAMEVRLADAPRASEILVCLAARARTAAGVDAGASCVTRLIVSASESGASVRGVASGDPRSSSRSRRSIGVSLSSSVRTLTTLPVAHLLVQDLGKRPERRLAQPVPLPLQHRRRWLPARLSGVDPDLDPHGGRAEEFIAPKMVSLAREFEIDDRVSFDARVNFAAEEVKHMNLFREVRTRVDRAVGFPLALIGDEKAVARAVLAKSTGAVLLLTAAIEWFTQAHYLTAFRDDDGLDAFTKHIFKHHWVEEAQHAKMDHLETLRAFDRMSDAEKDAAVGDLIELVGALDGLLQQQAACDVQNFEAYLGRSLGDPQRRGGQALRVHRKRRHAPELPGALRGRRDACAAGAVQRALHATLNAAA